MKGLPRISIPIQAANAHAYLAHTSSLSTSSVRYGKYSWELLESSVIEAPLCSDSGVACIEGPWGHPTAFLPLSPLEQRLWVLELKSAAYLLSGCLLTSHGVNKYL